MLMCMVVSVHACKLLLQLLPLWFFAVAFVANALTGRIVVLGDWRVVATCCIPRSSSGGLNSKCLMTASANFGSPGQL
jgi:hypothetical protein